MTEPTPDADPKTILAELAKAEKAWKAGQKALLDAKQKAAKLTEARRKVLRKRDAAIVAAAHRSPAPSTVQLAKEWGLSEMQVRRIIAAAGFPPPGRRRSSRKPE